MFTSRKVANKSVHELTEIYHETGQAFPMSGDARLFARYLELKATMEAMRLLAQTGALERAMECRANKLRHSAHYGLTPC